MKDDLPATSHVGVPDGTYYWYHYFFHSSYKRVEEYLRQSISIAVLGRTLILYLVIGTIFGGKWQ